MKKKNSPTFSLQEEAFLRGKDLEHSFFIAKDYKKNGAKLFSSFKSIKDFLLWFDKQEDKCFYEKIINERVEYYDIDGKIKENDYWKNDSKKILDDFFEARKNWIENTNYNNKNFNPEKDVFILEAEKKNEKKSFHIIIRNGFIFKNNLQQKTYIKEFKKYLDDLGSGLTIDDAPYGANQCFRTIGSSKLGSIRPLIRSNYNKNSLTCDRRLFFASNIEPELEKASEISCISLNCKLGIEENKSYLNFVSGFEVKEKIQIEFDENQVSPDEIKIMYDNLNPSRWDNRNNCLSLIWLGKKLGLTDKDLHYYCKTSDKYDENWVQSIINTRREECNLTIGTLKYFLIQDVDKDTLNNIFPKQKTFQEILQIPKKDRTKQEQDYYDKIVKKITQKNIDFLMKPTIISPVNDNSEYVQEEKFNTQHKVICVKAGLGRGKSYASIQHIKNNQYDNIIILTPRRSYAKSCCDRMIEGTGLDFKCYLNIKKKLIETPFIVIQAESLHRLNILDGNNLLIIDEVEAFLYQLTSTQTHAENHIKNVETFISLVKNSSKILALDAFLSNRTLETFNLLLSKNDISFINYTQKLKQRKVTRIDDIDIFISKMIYDLEQGKKIFLFSSSNSKLLQRKRKVYKNPNKEDVVINALLPAIREKFPDKNILEFHSNFVSVQLKNVNEDWNNADLVACTSTITVGINHDKKNVFHKLYLYANASSQNLVRDMFQASYRVRHLIDEEMVCCIDSAHYGKNLTTNINEIKQNLHDRHASIINHFKNYTNKQFPYETPQFIEYLSIFNKLESNLSIMNLEDFFNAYLQECNYKYCEDEEDIIEIEFDEFIKPQIDYDDIVEILPSVAKALINKKKTMPLTEAENSSLEKYHFQNILLYRPKDLEKPLWDIYTNFGKGKFRNISTEKGLKEGTITIQDIIDKNSYSHLNNGFSMRCHIIGEIFNWIGLNNSQEYTTKIKRDTLENVIQKFEENRKKIHIAFDIKEQTKGELTLKSTLGLINSVLNKWGYSNIKTEKREMKRINGKRTDVSDFVVQNKNGDIDVHKYIKPRTITKEIKIHPMLKRGDERIITSDELEYIRLNTIL